MNGYSGKILRINLSDRKVSSIDTGAYSRWIGGHGMGSAIFFDLVKDKTIDGFDERNVVTIMTSPLTGTLAPGGASRTEVQGIGAQTYPVGWFTRSNLGGRFGAMLKAAGWDGVVIEGKADSPVWVDIRNHMVKIRDALHLWGKDTWETQAEIWKEVCGSAIDSWKEFKYWNTYGFTRQRPAVLTIGPVGERKGRIASLIHDAGNSAGQGGFGGVWGSKNLKAVSVIGTGSVKVADPNALIKAREWAIGNYRSDIDDPKDKSSLQRDNYSFAAKPGVFYFFKRQKESRPQACVGCVAGCRERNRSGYANESGCYDVMWYTAYDVKNNFARPLIKAIMTMIGLGDESSNIGRKPDVFMAIDLAQKHGINCSELSQGIPYIRALHKMGALGPGREIDCGLPFDKYGEYEFADELLGMIARREGIGDDMAEGFCRAAGRWGRMDQDLESGLLNFSYWGLPDHFYDPRCQLEWGYGSIMGDRDVNEHEFIPLFLMSSVSGLLGFGSELSAEEAVTIYSEKIRPFHGDPMMLDYGDAGMYSEGMAKLVAWHRHFTRFWKQSVLYCDNILPDIVNMSRPDRRGMSGESEPMFLNAVLGTDMDFEDGVELGRKIWNLDNAIWSLQGRHRDMVYFSEYVHKQPAPMPYTLPAFEDGKWKFKSTRGRYIEKDRFDDWKTKFYKLEGWDIKSGRPTRGTLAALEMNNVADELERSGKLGEDENDQVE
jgi:aldehyde:ferredoxin oxidoreductase